MTYIDQPIETFQPGRTKVAHEQHFEQKLRMNSFCSFARSPRRQQLHNRSQFTRGIGKSTDSETHIQRSLALGLEDDEYNFKIRAVVDSVVDPMGSDVQKLIRGDGYGNYIPM
jgi:hypothetical protein